MKRLYVFVSVLLMVSAQVVACYGYAGSLSDKEDEFTSSFISHCDDTGEWGKSYGPNIAVDNVNYVEGTGGLMLTATNGAADDVRVYRDISPLSWDLSGSIVSLDFYIYNQTSLSSIVFRFWNPALTGNYYLSTVTLYQTNFIEGWNTISLAKSNMALSGVVNWNEVRRFSVDVVANAAQTTVVTIDNIRIVERAAGGFVTIRFDDGDRSLTNVSAFMHGYGFRGVAAVITGVIPATNNGVIVGLDELQTMNQRGWDIISHLNSSGVTLTSISTARAEAELRDSQTWLRAHGFNLGSRFLATPEHRYNAATLTLIDSYYLGCMTLANGHQDTPPHDTNRITVRAVHNTTAVATVEGWIDTAVTNEEWLILLFHKLRETPGAQTEYTPADFDAILNYLDTNNVPVVTLSDVYDMYTPAPPGGGGAGFSVLIIPIVIMATLTMAVLSRRR